MSRVVLRVVTLREIDPIDPRAPMTIRAKVVRTDEKTAWVRHESGDRRAREGMGPWTMPVSRATGKPKPGSGWAWRVAKEDLRVLSADLPTDPADERIVDALVADKTPEGRPMRARLDSDGTTQPPHVDSAKAKDEP